MSATVLVVGGERHGEYLKWFGHRVHIQRGVHVLHRVKFTDGTRREYYVLEGVHLVDMTRINNVERIEVCG